MCVFVCVCVCVWCSPKDTVWSNFHTSWYHVELEESGIFYWQVFLPVIWQLSYHTCSGGRHNAILGWRGMMMSTYMHVRNSELADKIPPKSILFWLHSHKIYIHYVPRTHPQVGDVLAPPTLHTTMFYGVNICWLLQGTLPTYTFTHTWTHPPTYQ